MAIRLTLGVLAASIAVAAQAENDKAGAASMEQVVIIGSQSDAKKMAGSAFVIDDTELAKFNYTDIHRILRQVPGVYIQQEDGYGLRPNIGIRGAGGSRSEKITLLEDGVLIAPAPYAGPSAYYFPTTGRMTSVEVLKGVETISQGPYTVGGAINLISTAIPSSAKGLANFELGEDGENRVHLWYGDSDETVGWLVETHQQNADGFKSIDRSGSDTGFNKEDYMAKLRVNSPKGDGYYNQLDIKLQYSTETSNQSYLGLTDVDFDSDPNRRYGISELDQMQNEHASITVSHLIEFSDSVTLKTTAYYNDFERDWFKLSGGGALIDAANNGDVEAQEKLSGVFDFGGIKIKHNARQYESYGLQSKLNFKVAAADLSHDIDIAVRIHEDEVDRFQPTDIYEQVNGELVFDEVSPPSSSNNRVENAEARSFNIMDHIAVNERLDVTVGLRYEDVSTDQHRYTDVDRSASNKTAANNSDEWLFALGATYQLNDQWAVLGGVHQGYAPAGPGSEDVEPEKSANFEAGVRYSDDRLFAEAIAFYSDYENSVQYCTVANPCGTATSGSESNGEAEIAGMELLINYDLSNNGAYNIPVSLSYTYTDAEITEDSADGSRLDGDLLNNVAETQWAASIAYIATSGWGVYLNASYTDETCIDNSCDRKDTDSTYKSTDDLLVFDFASNYSLSESVKLYCKVDNVFDKQKIISRSPDGARANKPRTAYVGVEWSF